MHMKKITPAEFWVSDNGGFVAVPTKDGTNSVYVSVDGLKGDHPFLGQLQLLAAEAKISIIEARLKEK